MKNFYNELQEEMKDLLELETELTNEQHLKLLEGKKEEFFTMMINNVEDYKKQYSEKETELTEELTKLHKAVNILNKKYKDKDYYKRYAINGALKIMAKSDELVKLQTAKEDSLKCFDETIDLLQQIKDGKLSTTEFSDRLKEYEEALKNAENALDYRSSLAADFLRKKEDKTQVKEDVESENKEEKEDSNINTNENENESKQEDIHPVVVDGQAEYKKFGIFNKYKAKKDAYVLTIGEQPNFARKIKLFFDNTRYSEIAKEYLNTGALKVDDYKFKNIVNKEKLNDYVERNKENLKEGWIKATTQTIPEKLKSEEFRSFVRVAEVGVATALLSACTLYITHPLETFKNLDEKNKKTIEFVDDKEVSEDKTVSDNEIAPEELAERLAKIDPYVSTHVTVDYNRESMLEKEDPYSNKNNKKQSFKNSIKFNVNNVDVTPKTVESDEILDLDNEEDILKDTNIGSTDEILDLDNDDDILIDNDDHDILEDDDILSLDDDQKDDDDIIIDDDNNNEDTIEDDILLHDDIKESVEEVLIGDTASSPVKIDAIGLTLEKEDEESRKGSVGPVKLNTVGLKSEKDKEYLNEENKENVEVLTEENNKKEEEQEQVIDGQVANDTIQAVSPQIGDNMTTEEIQAQIDQLNAEISAIQSKYTSTRDFNIDAGVQVMQILEANGLSKIAAAGITGNIFQESRFVTDATNGSHWGLCQWSKGRWANVKNWMNDNGKEGLQGQVEAALYGEPAYAPVVEELKAATTVEEASKIWQDKYEVCGGQTIIRKKAANIAYKASQAKELQAKLALEMAKKQKDDDMER